MNCIEVYWDDVAELIDEESGSCQEMGDNYLEFDTKYGWFRLQNYGYAQVTVHTGEPLNPSPTQETALGYLRSLGVKPILFEVAEIDLGDFQNEEQLARYLKELVFTPREGLTGVSEEE